MFLGSGIIFYLSTLDAAKHWADREGLTLLDIRSCWLRPNPFRYSLSFQWCYEVRVQDESGAVKQAWLRVNGYTDRVEVLWEGSRLFQPFSKFTVGLICVAGVAMILACAPIADFVAVLFGSILLVGGLSIHGLQWWARRK